MNGNHLIIKNGFLVSSNGIVKKDILINNGTIENIGSQINEPCDNIIDAENLYIMPGAIDPQVHFREPGLTHKEDIESGSRSAVAGGVTTFFEMPNTNPSTISIELLNKKNQIAANTSVANYSFFLGATHDNIEEIKKIKDNCGLKIFMGSSTGDLLVDSDAALDKIFKHCNKVIAIHSEDEAILQKMASSGIGKTFTDHPKVRPVEAAVTSTVKAIGLALKYKKRLHILHLSTAEEVEIIRKHKHTNLITSETTPQHLLLSAPSIYEKIGALGQMNPPIRERYHQDELWRGVLDGTIDCIATDHSPHTLEEKKQPYGKAPSGMPGVETSLPLMLNEVSNNKITFEQVVKWMCENPAKIYNVKNKGFLKIGYDADIAIVDMKLEKILSGSKMQSKCGWTAFEGQKIKGSPIITIVNGNIVYKDGKIIDDFKGRPVNFNE